MTKRQPGCFVFHDCQNLNAILYIRNEVVSKGESGKIFSFIKKFDMMLKATFIMIEDFFHTPIGLFSYLRVYFLPDFPDSFDNIKANLNLSIMKNHKVMLVFLILTISFSAFGQTQDKSGSFTDNSETSMDLHRSIVLQDDSDSKEVIIKLAGQTKRLEVMIRGSVTAGQLQIEFFSPENKREGNFTIGTLFNTVKMETVNGSIRKTLNEPQAGQWKIKIIPNEASGKIEILSHTEN